MLLILSAALAKGVVHDAALLLTAFVCPANRSYRAGLRVCLELERVRTRIAADLHDDLGSGLTRIAILERGCPQPLARTSPPSPLR